MQITTGLLLLLFFLSPLVFHHYFDVAIEKRKLVYKKGIWANVLLLGEIEWDVFIAEVFLKPTHSVNVH